MLDGKIEQKKNEPCISLSCLNAAFLDKMLTKCLTQRRRWHPTPVLLPGQSHGQRSLVGYSPWDPKESDTTERACTWNAISELFSSVNIRLSQEDYEDSMKTQ